MSATDRLRSHSPVPAHGLSRSATMGAWATGGQRASYQRRKSAGRLSRHPPKALRSTLPGLLTPANRKSVLGAVKGTV